MAHTLTFDSSDGVSVTVDGVGISSPYTLANNCTIVVTLTYDKTGAAQLKINNNYYDADRTIDISDDDITIVGFKGDTRIEVTINYTEASTPRLSVDLTTLSGWANLSAGSHNITIVAKASGFKDSAPSAAVQVTKAASMPVKGDIITLDSKQYRVLKTEGTVAEVLAMYNASTSVKFDDASDYNNTYAGKSLDTYCNSTFYSGLSAAMKSAIIDKTFTQDSWNRTGSVPTASHYTGKYGSSTYYLTLANAAFGTSITRHCYVLSVQDVLDYLNATTSMGISDTTLTDTNVWLMFWNSTTSHSGIPWLRSASAGISDSAFSVIVDKGFLENSYVPTARAVRPAFQIDLSKISWSK